MPETDTIGGDKAEMWMWKHTRYVVSLSNKEIYIRLIKIVSFIEIMKEPITYNNGRERLILVTAITKIRHI